MPNRASMNRRDFIATTTAATFAYAAARADTTRESLAALIHPDVQIVRSEIARDANAYWDWEEASDRLTSLDVFAERYFRDNAKASEAFEDEFDFANAASEAMKPSAIFPRGPAAACVRAWLDQSEGAIRRIDQGIAKKHFRLPQAQLLDFPNAVDNLGIPRNAARLKTAQCLSALHHGNEERAVQAAIDLIDIGKMALEGDGYLVHYLVAMGVYCFALESVQSVVFHPKTTHESLQCLRHVVQASRPQIEPLARTFRIEVVYFTQHEVARLPRTDDLSQLVDALIEQHLIIGDTSDDGLFSNQETATSVREGMAKLFAGHPRPFSASDTIRLHSGIVATMLGDLHTPWLRRKQNLAKPHLDEVASWPASLWFLDDIVLSILGGEAIPNDAVNDDAIEAARKSLHRVHNPIGKLMMRYVAAFENARRSFHVGQLNADVALLMIAVRTFRNEYGRLPHKLSELVEAKMLESVPIDPFSGEPMRYDSLRRIVWSFGNNATDNVKDWDVGETYPDGNDFVWRIPGSSN